MAINPVPGDPNANSYTDVAYADNYFSARLHAEDWFTATQGEKESSLQWATQLIDPEDWYGIIATDAQALRHPRKQLYDADGRLLPDDIVAKAIQDGTCEYALVLYRGDVTLDTGLEGYDSLQVDVINLGINQAYVADDKLTLPVNVQRKLNGYIRGTAFGLSRSMQIEMARG